MNAEYLNRKSAEEEKSIAVMIEKSTISIFKDCAEPILNMLTLEEGGELLQKIVKFAVYGEEEESNNRFVEVTYRNIRPGMLRAAASYDEAKASGKLGGIIGTLKSDKNLSQEKIDYLHENYTAEELIKMNFTEDMLQKAGY